jgi:flagellar assembly protein FliH
MTNTSFSRPAMENAEAAEVQAFVYADTLGPVHNFADHNLLPAHASSGENGANGQPQDVSKDLALRLRAEALAEGMREGEHRALQSFENKLEQERNRIAQILVAFQQERSQYFAKVEVELVHLALAIAAKILRREAQVDRLLVAGLVKVMLERLNRDTNVVARVRPEDVPDWKKYFRENPSVQVVDDASVEPMGCILETELGITDMGLNAQLKEIEQGFFDLLAQRPEPK